MSDFPCDALPRRGRGVIRGSARVRHRRGSRHGAAGLSRRHERGEDPGLSGALFRARGGWRLSFAVAYAHKALACVATHDLPTLKGWWRGSDIDERAKIGLPRRRTRRERLRTELPTARAARRLAREAADLAAALEPDRLCASRTRRPAGRSASPCTRCLRGHPRRLVAVQLEDLVGIGGPGQRARHADEHPNWRRKLPVALESLEASALFTRYCAAHARERPRIP